VELIISFIFLLLVAEYRGFNAVQSLRKLQFSTTEIGLQVDTTNIACRFWISACFVPGKDPAGAKSNGA